MKRQFHIFNGFEHRDQVVELKNKTDVARTPVSQFRFGKPGDIDIPYMNTAFIRLIDPGNQVEERGFA